MHSENPNGILSKGSMLNPQIEQEVAVAMAEHIHFLNSWLSNRLDYLSTILRVAEEDATESSNAECLQLIGDLRHELHLTRRLVVPLQEFSTEDGGYLERPPVLMAAALAQTRAEWVDLFGNASSRTAK